MSYASRWAVIPDTVVQKVNHYGLGFLSAWSPQQLILAHPVSYEDDPKMLSCPYPDGCYFKVTGWFVTHGGHNSVVEAISQGIPMYVGHHFPSSQRLLHEFVLPVSR